MSTALLSCKTYPAQTEFEPATRPGLFARAERTGQMGASAAHNENISRCPKDKNAMSVVVLDYYVGEVNRGAKRKAMICDVAVTLSI